MTQFYKYQNTFLMVGEKPIAIFFFESLPPTIGVITQYKAEALKMLGQPSTTSEWNDALDQYLSEMEVYCKTLRIVPTREEVTTLQTYNS